MTGPDDSSQGFFGRWSRKKIEAEGEAVDAPAESRAPEVPRVDKVDLPAKAYAKTPVTAAETPSFDLDSLPSLDSITAVTDIRGFLTPGVPKELARAALRRAWAADPTIRDFKGLAENDWDFTDPTAMPGFGPLPPGYDVKKMVAQIFGGSEPPVNPDGAANRSAEREAPQIPEEIGSPASAANSSASMTDEKAASAPELAAIESQISSAEIVQRNNSIASHNNSTGNETEEPKIRRSHGGALPQ